jgi:ribonuclease R
MDFLKEPVLSALNRAGRPLKAKELAREVEVEGADYRAFRAFLRELTANGELYRVKGGRYAPPDRINLVVGHLVLIRSGAAFLISEKPGEDDVFVPADELGNAYHGDKVVVRVEKHRRRGRPEGRVVRVLERARSEFVGTVHRGKHLLTVSPDDPKFPRDIYVPADQGADSRDGQKVMVEVLDWGSATSGPVGRIAEVLGMPGDPGLDVLIIIKHNGLPTAFPEAVAAAADALPDAVPEDEIATRADFRAVPVVTIDPVNAKDFDDALSLAETADGNLELGVHIADVSHYVRYGPALDKEARHRGTSVYLVDRVLPMLPEKLSNHLCSLNPGMDRLAMSVILKMTPGGKVLDYRIEDTVIRSTRRLTYEQVQGYFEGDRTLALELAGVTGLLDRLRKLAAALHAMRTARGALDFDLPASRVELDENGLPVDIHKVVRLESHRLVEEFMLLANETVAHHLKRLKADTLYRVHEDPKEEKLEDLQAIIARFGYSLNVDSGGRVPPRELQRVLAACEDKPEELIVNTLVLRSLARARYDPFPLGHYGLALRDYLHFTSPIRRYPDLVVHRTLRVLSKRQPPPMRDNPRYREWMGDTAIRSSERERLAEGAERDSVELKKIQFMERHIGETFEGVITSVEVFGFFVELTRYHVSGLVHINNLGDDYYEYEEDEYSLVGSHTGRTFTLGDPVTVNVLSVSKELRQIDFLLEDGETAENGSPARKLRKAKRDFEGDGKSKRPPSPRPEARGKGKRGTSPPGRSAASRGKKRRRG